MAFTLAERSYDDTQEKILMAHIRLLTLNDVTPLAPDEFVNSELDRIMTEAETAVGFVNAERRLDAMKKATPETIAKVNAELGLTDFENVADIVKG